MHRASQKEELRSSPGGTTLGNWICWALEPTLDVVQGNVLPGLYHLPLLADKSHPEVEYDVENEEHFNEDVTADGGLEVGGVTKCSHPEQRKIC